ncbi:MAG TPA: hypothetical protein VGL72_00710 [Bryobacteraceae bacterium]|jgi:hypothetical protein
MMPILQSETGQSATRKILLTTGLGIIFGLLFGIPPALGLHTLGVAWLPSAVITLALVVGFFLAYLIVDFVLTATTNVLPTASSPPPDPPFLPPAPKAVITAIGTRLADAKACLDGIDEERKHMGKPGLGKMAEQRIVWNELLDLELQDIDEQLEHILHAQGTPGNTL